MLWVMMLNEQTLTFMHNKDLIHQLRKENKKVLVIDSAGDVGGTWCEIQGRTTQGFY